MEPWKRLLLENKAWAQDKGSHAGEDAPGDTKPEFLWIGCSDARQPAEKLTGSSAGELYVHRNLGNLVVHTDLNMLAVLECAVRHMGVNHIIVCGHYECRGVEAALSRENWGGLMNAWLNHIKDTWRSHKDELALHDEGFKHRRLVELNVLRQVHNLARTAVVQREWADAKRPTLHGWVYNPHDHLITPLVKVDAETPLDDVHRITQEVEL